MKQLFDNALLQPSPDALCRDLAVFYPDEASRLCAEETAQLLANLGMAVEVIRVGYVGRLRLQPEGLPAAAWTALNAVEQSLVTELEKLNLIDILHENKNQDIEKLRQMLIAMANDIRVVVIKLALQLVAMRHLSEYPEAKRLQLALQTRDIQAPLANRLGIAKIKWELEDLALKALEPTTYRLISSSLSEQRREREAYVESVIQQLQTELAGEGITQAKIYGRAKHINSIFSKMKKKHKRLEEIYDLLALRVQVDNLRDCYTVLGIVHSLWQHIPSEFDDYIANPKPNGYQSLHTAVVGPEGKTIEIQIRTHQMHEFAEHGVAAHWRYKENNAKSTVSEQQINWLRSLIAEPDEDLVEEFTAEIAEDRIYVITPQGKVMDLPNGATALDFAYHVHTDIGHRTKGARVNGHIVPISQALQTGDTVEILTGPKNQPSRDWLNSQYLKSPRARAKVRYFFKQLERDRAIEEGRDLLEGQLSRLHFSPKASVLLDAAKRFNYKTLEDLHAALGFGDLGLVAVVNYIEQQHTNNKIDFDDIETRLSRIPIRHHKKKSGSVTIAGIDDLLISMATCCNPVPPEPITGYITKTKGIRIHRHDCKNLQAMAITHPDNTITVEWVPGLYGFSTLLHIQGQDRIGLLRDISQALVNEGVTIQKANFGRDEDLNINLQMQITVHDTDHLHRALEKIKQIKNIQSAIRVEGSLSS
ncbi:RelA/SpoT family protein [Ostreibacterium oceani]|uniref:GTP pyrophosphokinase n=1 Tax=Ostreibacterium oceani TaxID=2654998 RepID=A0A6N7EXE0_9GAMM|nr:bifunctional (p)ppGpp synthetase/guanosine-3',5'-bis(diphosphate) 3'-pyrophosphohydrolase [Ostreibacterium oceani]MPV85138.1 RelA/SpoT family protein [Ostreibacterium oceani]